MLIIILVERSIHLFVNSLLKYADVLLFLIFNATHIMHNFVLFNAFHRFIQDTKDWTAKVLKLAFRIKNCNN